MDEWIKVLVQSSGAAVVAFIALYYGNKTHTAFMHTIDTIQNRFTNTIDTHLKNANEAQKEDARAKQELALKLQDLSNSNKQALEAQKEAKEITQKLYKELLKVKKPQTYEKVINIQ